MRFIKFFFSIDLSKIFIYGGNIVINKFIGFVILFLITKQLDQSIVGQYFIFLNIQSILVSTAILGIPNLIIKELSLNIKKKINDNLIKKTIVFCLFISISFLALLSVFFYFYYKDISFILLIFVSSLITLVNSIFFYFYLASEKILFSHFLS